MILLPLAGLTGPICPTAAMLDVERALARAQARVGVIPASAAAAIHYLGQAGAFVDRILAAHSKT
jgi:adenylosuccinate lyase